MARTGLGNRPFGYGTPASQGLAPIKVIVSNFVGVNKDYEIDEKTGELAQMPVTRQRVFLAISETLRSSVARPLDGILLPKKITEKFEREVADAVTKALYQLIEVDEVIEIDSIEVVHEGSRAKIIVSYTDLSTKQLETVSTTSI